MPVPTNGRKFQKGQSGNPGGRPKAAETVRDLARSHTTEAMQALVKIATKGKSESAKVQAATAILERGWGKPLQQVEVKRTPFDELSPDELRAVAEALEAISLEEGGPASGHTGEAGEGKALGIPTLQ
jgi:hypothetical protein